MEVSALQKVNVHSTDRSFIASAKPDMSQTSEQMWRWVLSKNKQTTTASKRLTKQQQQHYNKILEV